MIIGLVFPLFLCALFTAVVSISPAILQPVFPRSGQVIIAAAAAEIRPPPAHVIATSPALLPTPHPAGIPLKVITDVPH